MTLFKVLRVPTRGVRTPKVAVTSTPDPHLSAGCPNTFAPSVKAKSGPTFLFKGGAWEAGLKEAPRILERYTKAR